MRMVLAVVALMGALLTAGCLEDPTDAPAAPRAGTGQTVEERECPEAAEMPLRLARHTDHSGGTSEYWTLWPNGTILRVWGHPTLPGDQTQITFVGPWNEPAKETLCAAMAGFVDRSVQGRPWHTSMTVNGASVQWVSLDADRVAPLLDEAMDLPADSSRGCFSGGDTWLEVQDSGRRHAVEARCAPDDTLAAWLERLYDATGLRPFVW